MICKAWRLSNNC